MTAFRVDSFSGERPLLNARKMPDGAARSAYDCDLVANDLRAFRTQALVAAASVVSTATTGFVFNENQMFLFTSDVDATFGPLQADSEYDHKVFISSGFQAYPVYSTRTLGMPTPGGTYYGAPIAWRKLGVPPAPTAPIIVQGGIPTGAITGTAIVGDLLEVTCSADHGLEANDKVMLEGFHADWSDVNSNTFSIELVEGSTVKFTLRNYDPAAHSTGAPSGPGTWTQEYNSEDYEDRIYLWTLVTDQGEEGPPSDPSELVTMAPGQSITITTGTSPDVDGAIVAFKRIYRTLPTSSGEADYYFVTEIPVSQAEFVDTVAFIQLGERIPSIEWSAPPEELKGLVALPNGVLAGFVDRTLYLSEPYQPHAWPDSYTKQMDNTIVGLAAFGQSLVVATVENPYIATATDPLSMTLSKLDSVEPCIAKRACKSLGYGVIYPSPNGLILVTPGGTKNVLDGIWDEREWRSLFATYGTAFADVHDGKYYLLFSGGHGIVFDPSSDTLEISHLTITNTNGMLVDRDEDRLYLLRSVSGQKVYQWNPDDGVTFIEANWRSQTFVMPYPVNMGAFQVFFDDTGTVEVDFYADGVLKHTATVANQEPQRLPSGFLAREWFLDIRTTVEVQGIYVAETISELRGALAR